MKYTIYGVSPSVFPNGDTPFFYVINDAKICVYTLHFCNLCVKYVFILCIYVVFVVNTKYNLYICKNIMLWNLLPVAHILII